MTTRTKKSDAVDSVLEPVKEAFIAGDPEAMTIIYNRMYGPMVERAYRFELQEADAQDAAMDAMLYVQGRGTAPDNLAAALIRAAEWFAKKLIRDKGREVPISSMRPGEFEMDGMDSDSSDELLDDADDFAGLQGQVHPLAPAHMQACTLDHPELIVERQDAIQKAEKLVRQELGGAYWDMFSSVESGRASQAELAERYGISQPTVFRRIQEVKEFLMNKIEG